MILKLTLLALLAVPAAASAATIQHGSVIKYDAAPGEENRVRMSMHGTDMIAVRDVVPIAQVPSRCVRVDNGVACPYTTSVTINLGDRADDFTNTVGTATFVHAGAGDDRYGGGLGPASRTFFDGEDGHDVVSYEAAGGGVVVSLDNREEDGRAGDRDNITSDVETVVGSHFRDELTGTQGSDVFHPLRGDDVVRGENGDDVVHMGATPDGSDTIDGGLGLGDVVSYAQRGTRVEVTPGWNGHDDGAPGERDEVVGTERVEGGRADDLIDARVAPPNPFIGAPLGYDLIGGDGADTLLGSSFKDVLIGGPRVDVQRGFDGNDILDSRDGFFETLECGAGNDTGMLDVSLGGVLVGPGGVRLRDRGVECESSRPIVVGRGAVSGVSVAGGAVSMDVSWTHPKRWRDLRRVDVALREGDRIVGRAKFTPRAGRGGLVKKRVRIEVGETFAGGALEAEIRAVDKRGRSERISLPAAVIV